VTIALAVRRIAPSLLIEARAACSSLQLPTEDWGGGIPRHAPRIVITSIDIGDRRIPDDVVGLLDATPGVRAVVCSSEPLIKPRIDLADGRVTLLSPPIDRARLVAVLRAALDAETPLSTPDASSRFEVLRRAYWAAWSRGSSSLPIQIHERNGVTLLFGSADIHDVVRTITADIPDGKLAAELAGMLGRDQAAIHLSQDTAEWRVYWPRRDVPLWMCSPHRLPTRWQINPTLGSGQRFLRISGFPQDQLIAGLAPGDVSDILAPVTDVVAEGGPATIGTLAQITAEHGALATAVLEIR
jgi:hypothetical protein